MEAIVHTEQVNQNLMIGKDMMKQESNGMISNQNGVKVKK